MKNFQPGGLRNRKPDLGGRPFSDAGNYAPKKRFEGNKPSFGSKPAFGANRDREAKDVTLYNATCTTCGKSCEVPFRPDGKKPVLCRDCFAAKNSAGDVAYAANKGGNSDRSERSERQSQPSFTRSAVTEDSSKKFEALTRQIVALEIKVTQILTLLATTEKVATAPSGDATSEKVKKVRKPKLETPAVKKAAAKKKVAKKASVAKKVAKK